MTLQTSESPTADESGTASRPLRFVLLCPQRSGSNALSSLLTQVDSIDLYGQLFNQSFEYRDYNRVMRLPLFRPHPESLRHFGTEPPWRRRWEAFALKFTRRERDLGRFLGRFWRTFASDPPPKAIGFKLHDWQLADDDLAELFDRHVDRIVILHRRNLLKSAVSWAVAIKTDRWVSHSATPATKPVTLDHGQLRWFIDKTRDEVARWERLATASPTPALTLTYEEHVAPRRLDPLFEFLGIGDAPGLDFTTRRLSSSRYEHVANASEIDERLGDDETGRLFD